MDPYQPPPLDTHPYYEIKNWSKHQRINSAGARFIKVYTNLLLDPRFNTLSLADRGLLVSIWLLRGALGSSLRRDASELAVSLRVHRNKHLSRSLIRLESRGFLIPVCEQRRVEEIRTPYPLRGRTSGNRNPEPDYQPTEDEIQAELERMGYEPKGGQTCPTKDSAD